MNDVQYVILEKDRMDNFISRLAKLQKVIAPVAKGYNNYVFEEVLPDTKVALQYIPTVIPPKKIFMPQRETLLEFDISRGLQFNPVVEYERVTLFGVHTCDLAAIQCINMVFSVRPRDFNYLMRKRKTDIIGIECNDYCDEYASCCLVSSHLPSGGYDLFFTDIGDCFIVHVNTQVGEEIVEATKYFKHSDKTHIKELESLREKKRAIFKKEVSVEPRFIPSLFDASFESKVWEDVGKKCLSCGNCTNVCPTCYCFDISDEIDINLKTGRRFRIWDSCQVEPFAKVAGGENFRKERSARQRHRYYRKFRYPVTKFGRFFCTGCGRCSRTCMAGIHLKDTLNFLIKDNEDRIWKKPL